MAGDLLRQLREFWRNLFGRASAPEETEAEEDKPRAPPRPFASFADPFATGMADRHSPEELVRYSFEALEAFARERGCAREPEQTPHEFARNVGVRCAPLSDHARRLANLYCRVAYARGALPPPEGTGHLRRLWEQLGRETPVTP